MPNDLSTLLLDCITAHRGLDDWYGALSDDFTASYPNARRGLTKDQARGYNEAFLPLMSDIRYEYTGSVTEGDTAYTRWIVTGTHDGPLTLEQFKSTKPSGKRISWPGVLIVQTRDGKIIREEMYWNQVELLDQLGLM